MNILTKNSNINITKTSIFFILITIAIITIDRLTKNYIISHIKLGESIKLLNILNLTYAQNKGAAFGILQGKLFFFITVSIFVIGLIIIFYEALVKSKISLVSISLILGGTIGNILDRIFYGFVIDFIDFKIWPIFNIADSALTIGIIIFSIYLILDRNNTLNA